MSDYRAYQISSGVSIVIGHHFAMDEKKRRIIRLRFLSLESSTHLEISLFIMSWLTG